MGSKKSLVKKLRLIAVAKRPAPRWCDIKKFGLKRARTRRIISSVKNWRRGKYKI
jgi:ribosomal protein L39E